MTVEEVKKQFEKYREEGMSDDEIAVTLYLMFKKDVMNAEEFAELMDILGYEVGDEFLNATPEEQKDENRWFESVEDEEGEGEDEPENTEKEPETEEEDDEEKARKLFGLEQK